VSLKLKEISNVIFFCITLSTYVYTWFGKVSFIHSVFLQRREREKEALYGVIPHLIAHFNTGFSSTNLQPDIILKLLSEDYQGI
jgi:hypothetical protein